MLWALLFKRLGLRRDRRATSERAPSRENGFESRLKTLNNNSWRGAFAELPSGPLGRKSGCDAQRGHDSSGPKRKALGPLTLAPLLLEVRDRLLDKAEVGGLVEARAEEVAREIGLEQAPEVWARGVKVGRGLG